MRNKYYPKRKHHPHLYSIPWLLVRICKTAISVATVHCSDVAVLCSVIRSNHTDQRVATLFTVNRLTSDVVSLSNSQITNSALLRLAEGAVRQAEHSTCQR